jgi:hypothetical protein
MTEDRNTAHDGVEHGGVAVRSPAAPAPAEVSRRVGTSTRRRPGRLRRIGHALAAVVGWAALVALAVSRLGDAPRSLSVPTALLLLGVASLLVVLALVWARTADRRRPPRPPA